LIVRQKDVFDNATPSANSLAANGLLRLAALTGNEKYAEPAVRVIGMLGRVMSAHPAAFAHALAAMERHLTQPLEIAVVGPRNDPRTSALVREVNHRFLPNAAILYAEPGRSVPDTPLLADRGLVDGAPAAYVCSDYACRQPVISAEELRVQIDEVLSERQRAAT
jgi:hypothetical protein